MIETIKKDDIVRSVIVNGSILDMPQFPQKDVSALVKTFNMYVNFSEDRWPEIRRAEEDDNLYEELKIEYMDRFWNEEISFEHSSQEINDFMPSVPVTIMHPDSLNSFININNHPLKEALRENDLYDWAPQSPTRLIHSYQDELVPYQNAEVAYENFLNNGASETELLLVNFGSHQDAAPSILMGVFYWFEQLKDSDIFMLGDINIDFEVNIIDIVILSDIITQNTVPVNSQIVLGDLNYDNINDILDIILIVNLILFS